MFKNKCMYVYILTEPPPSTKIFPSGTDRNKTDKERAPLDRKKGGGVLKLLKVCQNTVYLQLLMYLN